VGTEHELIEHMDSLHLGISAMQHELFQSILQAELCEIWVDSGARDLAHWLCMRYDISEWKVHRWIAAAHALLGLPRLSEAFSSGEIGVDKVVELTRFATPDTERDLVRWAGTVSGACIRRKADLYQRQSRQAAEDADSQRSLTWYYWDEGRRVRIEVDLPAVEGTKVVKRLGRIAEHIPEMPGEEGPRHIDERMADALCVMASGDAGIDQSTIFLHARVGEVSAEDGACEIEDGPVVHAEVARRLACTARIKAVLEDDNDQPLRLGRASREPTRAMMSLLKCRDFGCTFEGCGTRRFTQAHHVQWWRNDGPTDLENLILVCYFHHKLVHEYGWVVKRRDDGITEWYRRDGTRYRAGPAPPDPPTQPELLPELVAV
jgi:hypothetical protein